MRLPIISLFIIFNLSSPAYAVESLVINGLFKDTAIVTIDGQKRVLKAGNTSPEGVNLIRADSEAAVIEIDGQQNTYHLGNHISSSFRAAPEKASVSIVPDKNGMYLISGSIDNFPVKFLVDTGATFIAMNEQQARRLGIDYKMIGVEGSTSTASGIAKAWYFRLKKVKVGALMLRDVEAAVIKGEHPAMVLLGNSFLNRLQMVRHGQIMELRTR